MSPANDVHTQGEMMTYSLVRVDGLPGSCGICFRDVPAVAETQAVDDASDAGRLERCRTTTLFTCRECSPGRAAVLFDAPGLELFNGSLQHAA